MKIKFITTNKHKVAEVQEVLNAYGVELEQISMEYEEDKEATMEEVCKKVISDLANQVNEPVIIEDTGFYFLAYNNFPGALPKFVFSGIGFDGILRLLKGKDRSAYFKTILAYCEPDGEPRLFSGEMHGKILEEVVMLNADVMPYDKIFVPDGFDKAIVEMSMQEKNKFSMRAKAANEFGKYLKSLNN